MEGRQGLIFLQYIFFADTWYTWYTFTRSSLISFRKAMHFGTSSLGRFRQRLPLGQTPLAPEEAQMS